LKDQEYQTNFLARASAPLGRFFTGLGDRIEKRRRTFTSWFTDKDFTDLPALAGKLSQHQDPLSKFIYDNLSADTQKLLTSQDEKRLRDSLAKDLNLLIDRELRNKAIITEKSEEKYALEQDAAVGSLSPRKRQRLEDLEKEIGEL